MSPLEQLLFLLTLLAVLGTGMMAGLFYVFSGFMMTALDRLPPASGIAAMQSINVAILNPLFMALFMGTGAICLPLVIWSMVRWQNPAAAFLLAGSALYLVGNIFVTMAFNVPRNDALARLDPSTADAVGTWRTYVVEWTRWNHVRTVTALAATVLLTLGACRLWAVAP